MNNDTYSRRRCRGPLVTGGLGYGHGIVIPSAGGGGTPGGRRRPRSAQFRHISIPEYRKARKNARQAQQTVAKLTARVSQTKLSILNERHIDNLLRLHNQLDRLLKALDLARQVADDAEMDEVMLIHTLVSKGVLH